MRVAYVDLRERELQEDLQTVRVSRHKPRNGWVTWSWGAGRTCQNQGRNTVYLEHWTSGMQNCRRMGLCHVMSPSITVITKLLISDQKRKQDSKTEPLKHRPHECKATGRRQRVRWGYKRPWEVSPSRLNFAWNYVWHCFLWHPSHFQLLCATAEKGGTQTGKQRCTISTWHIHRELEEAKLLCPSTTVQSQTLLGREDLTQNIQYTLPKGKKKILNSTRLELRTSAYQQVLRD